MDLAETIDAVLSNFCTKVRSTEDHEVLVQDVKRRLMLICMSYVCVENDNLLSYLPPMDVIPTE